MQPVHESYLPHSHGIDEGVSSGPLVMLISMPWEYLAAPSIQLGILQSVLERDGIRTEVRTLKLAFIDHCLARTSNRPEAERIALADYGTVAFTHFGLGLGEWIFAVPPFAEHGKGDEPYLAYLRGKGVPESDITKALVMRALVPGFLERCVDDIVAAAPRIVGFTSAFNQNVPSLVLAKMLKLADPSLKIIFGGANCDGPTGAALHRTFPWIDAVVRGEGESVLPELVRDFLTEGPLRPQPGLCYRNGERSVAIDQSEATVPMDEIPTPNFDEYFARLEKTSFCTEVLPRVRLPYETSRGCWWGAKSHCTFCGLNGTGMMFRSKTADRVVEELYAMAARYGRLSFQLVDNIMDMRYLQDLLPRLRDTGYDLSLFYEIKANLKKEHVRLLRDSGVDHVQPGIESFSNPILRLMRKGVTALQNVRLLKWCAEYGVRVNWAIIYGCPGEPPEEYARMAEVLPSLAHFEPPMQLVRLVLDRFSPYHERPAEFGLEVLGPLSYYRFIYPTTDEQTLSDLAYSFEYRYHDGRDPESYVEPLRPVIDSWQAGREDGYRSLSYRRGPGFLMIRDRRPNLESADYTLENREARIYMACEDGATPVDAYETVHAAGIHDVTPDEVREFLDELVESRLVYEDSGKYLALALPLKSSGEI